MSSDSTTLLEELKNLKAEAKSLKIQGRYVDAEIIFRKVLDSDLELYQNRDNAVIAEDLRCLGVVLMDQGRYTEAEQQAREAVELFAKTTGKEKVEYALALHSLAELLRKLDKFDEAEPLYRQSLDIRIKNVGDGDPVFLAKSLNNFGVLLHVQGKYDEAKLCHEQVVALWKDAFREEHPELAKGLNLLGELARKQGKFEEAELLYRQAIVIVEKTLGMDHVDLAIPLTNLGLLLSKKGKYDEAKPFHERALAAWKKAFGENHPEVATGLYNLAELYINQGKNDEAELLSRQALAIDRKEFGDDHPDVAKDLNSLATALGNQGKIDEAEQLYQQVLTLHRKVLGEDDPEVAKDLINLAFLMSAKGDYLGGEKLLCEAQKPQENATQLKLTNTRITLPVQSPTIGVCWTAELPSQEKLSEAISFQKRALVFYKKIFGEDQPAVATLLDNLALLLRAQGKHFEARKFGKQAFAIALKSLGEDHPTTISFKEWDETIS